MISASRSRALPFTAVLLVAISFGISGCATFRVVNKKGKESGLLYYPPKPYLLITKNVNVPPAPADTKKSDDKPDDKSKGAAALMESVPGDSGSPLDKLNLSGLLRTPTYGAQVVFLPDLSDPQHVYMKTGIGTVDSTFGLTNGWQLNALNVKLNSQVPETIEAIGGALGAGAGLIPTPAAAAEGGMSRLEAVVQILGMLRGAPPTQFTESDTAQQDAENEIKRAIADLLRSLKDELQPRIWLYGIRYDCDSKRIVFEHVDGLFPFEFR